MSADEHAVQLEEAPVKRNGHSMLAIILIAFISGAAGGFVVKVLPWGSSVPAGLQETTGKDMAAPGNSNVAADPNIAGSIKESPGKEDEATKTEPGLLELAEFVTNIGDPFGNRAIEVEFKLLLSDKVWVEKIKKNKILMALIRDQIHMILSTKTYKDLRGTSGKTVLFEEVMMQVNEVIKQAFGVEPVVRVLHTVWKLQ